ncbi:MAG: SLBB domain-containing protein [Candidatus Zixiibacteriota bacterium]|nr:MAG: SLBB domain-containing protein [candidate division Zixibacteria bacterium]
MKRFITWSLLVFILVALNWFRAAYCQALVDEELLQKYQEAKNTAIHAPRTYSTPEIFVDTLPMLGPDGASINSDMAGTGELTHQSLKPFGYDLFRMPSELSPPSEVADAADYILGPGDNIIIYLWGKVEKEYNLTVDRQGKIFIPKVGEVIVWGLKLSEFEERITKKLSQAYSDFRVSVSLGKIRSIRVYLTGEVSKPGAYTISSLTTLFNALYLAGGPNMRGSMRDIKLIRNNRVEATVDLYQFLLKGDSKSDVRLSSGDAIFVPIAGPRATVSGEVKRPAIYELQGGETVSRLLELAGGTRAEAYLDRIMLDRISPEDEREVVDLNMNPKNGAVNDIELIGGDILTVFSIYELKRNIVSIGGMVKHPGQFERSDSTSLRSLIMQGELLPENVYFERANLFRKYPDRRVDIIPINLESVMSGQEDMPLQDLDSLHVYSIDDVKRREFVYVEGEVKRPGKYQLYDNMTLSDLVFLAGNFRKNAYRLNVELARTDSLGQVALKNIDMTDSAQCRLRLEDDDRIFVREIPDWFLHRTVTVEGEVAFPGQYALLSRSETLYGLIKRAGGFTENAFPKGTIFTRRTISRNLEMQNLPEIIANSQPLKEDSSGTIKKVELIRFNPENVNRVIIDMEKIIDSEGLDGNLGLQNNDYVFVPEIPTGISVMGAVGANGTIKYLNEKNVKYYIERAGNFTNQADKKGTRLIKADGRVFARGGTLGKKVELGDAIVVPTEIKKDRDWLKTLSTTVSIIGGLATTVFIIDRL